MANADRIIELLHEAKARPAGAVRERFLAEACGDDAALKEQIVSLIEAEANERDSDFLKHRPLIRQSALVTEKAGDRIGRYKLLEQIGEGGCGVVYMAEQEEPVRRRVALKVIKLGMDTQQVIARFEAERQALALMDHPNIAKVHDGGATDTGRPFFVMELVRGTKITAYCDQNNLSTNERLELFIQVCQAIQHAHQKGIIHRDIKPSNILVTQHDDVAVPKVIDFGIAKATTGQLTDKTLFTAFAQFIGTPAYMSPEQAQLSGLDVDTRSDIYSLGVLLYELLSGCTPFDVKDLLNSGLDKMRRIICDTEPLRPSTRLGTLLPDELTASAQHRKTDAPKLVHLLRGDLDWIVMRCIEKDRARRYETATGLAADVHRYLNHQPVNARPPSALYRLEKLVRRNKVMFATGVSIIAVLLIGAGLSMSQAIRAQRAEREQFALRRQADAVNNDLRHMVSLLELQHAEGLFAADDSVGGVAHLAAMLRREPSNHIAAHRLVSALSHRNWALPATKPMRHQNRVVSANFSPDGGHVLSSSWDKTAMVWDAATGQALIAVRHADQVISARYSREGALFVTASADGTARIWNATNGLPLTPPLKHRDKVHWAEFSPDGQRVVTASADKTARLWDADSGASKQVWRDHGTEVLFARFSPNGERIVTGTQSGTIRGWAADSERKQFELLALSGRLTWLEFSPDGRMLASAYGDGSARIWNLTNGQVVAVLRGHRTAVNLVAFSFDGRMLLTTSQDHSARLWNATNGESLGQPLRHEGDVPGGAFSADGKMLVTTSWDNTARLWDARTGGPLCQPLRGYEAMAHAAFNPYGSKLVTASWDQTVQVWDIQPRRLRGMRMSHDRRVVAVAFDSRGETVLSASDDNSARLWNARTGDAVGEPMCHDAPLRCAQYSADGQRIATGSDDGTARVWDAITGRPITGPLRHAKSVWFAQFSPDGERLVTTSADGTARIWNAQTGIPVMPPIEHGAPVKMARFSPDGRWIVTASENWSARVWDAHTGQPLAERLQHGDHVQWAEFSPDGRRVVTGSSDNSARIWEVRTGESIGPPLQHARTVEKVAFSPDGRRVATASLDRTVRVWDATTGEALFNPLMHDGYVSQVCFSPDGRRILTSYIAGASRLWDAETGRPLTEWLEPGGRHVCVNFDSTGRRLITGADDGTVRVMDVPFVPTPVPQSFLTFAEAVAGARLSARGNTELVSRQELEEIAQQLTRSDGDGFYERLSRWFLADPARRAASPF